METKFKTLVHNGEYVDPNMLDDGIYVSEKPFLYSKDDTLEKLIKRGRGIGDFIDIYYVSEDYFKNLEQCQLIGVTIKINK